jgi:UDP-glucuronate 4-epimerase
MSGMRDSECKRESVVLLTGGAGFIGSHTADHLLTRGDRVVIVDNMNDYYDPKLKLNNLDYLRQKHGNSNLTIIEGDISDKALMAKIFEEYQPDLVCHLAARAGVRASIEDPFTYLQANIEGTMVLLEESRKIKVKNFVYASSSSVYGNDLEPPFHEVDNTSKPISQYAATKKACELFAYTYSHLYKLPVSGLRFFTVYGPRGRPDMAIFKFIDKIYNGQTIDQYGDGNSMRDYTFVEDIVSGIVGALDNPQPYEVYNLGNGRPVNLKRMIECMQEALGIEANIRKLPMQAGDVDLTCADISHAQEMIGYSPKTTLEEGIRKTVEWYVNEYVPAKQAAATASKKEEEAGEIEVSAEAGEQTMDGEMSGENSEEEMETGMELHLEIQYLRKSDTLSSFVLNSSEASSP